MQAAPNAETAALRCLTVSHAIVLAFHQLRRMIGFFKDSWDLHMVHEYGAAWADTFAGWIQEVLDDDRSNAFSLFVHSETKRVFKDLVALHVPGN